jgi:hypothetical protein
MRIRLVFAIGSGMNNRSASVSSNAFNASSTVPPHHPVEVALDPLVGQS